MFPVPSGDDSPEACEVVTDIPPNPPACAAVEGGTLLPISMGVELIDMGGMLTDAGAALLPTE